MVDIDKYSQFLLDIGGTYMLNHARRTLYISKLLSELENLACDEEILTFACYFHDISAYKPYRPDGVFDHAYESSLIILALAREYGISEDKIDSIIEAVRYHDKRGLGLANETIIIRNADAIDYLGYIAAARDFSKQPGDMVKAISALKKHRTDFAALLELTSAIKMAEPRIRRMDDFIDEFERESFGMY